MRLYYNPQCSKSRAALALLEDAGYRPELVDYMATPPDAATLHALMDMLVGDTPDALVRTGDAVFAQLGESAQQLTRERVQVLLSAQPQLLQRPILVTDGRAIIARPPERVFDLIDDTRNRSR